MVLQQIRETVDGRFLPIAPVDLTREKLVYFSDYEADHLADDGLNEGSNALFLDKNYAVDADAMTQVLQWIADNNPVEPSPMSADALGFRDLGTQDLTAEDFKALVQVQHAAKSLCIKRQIRGDDVRDRIILYLMTVPLSCAEFALVMEKMAIDLHVTRIAKRHTMVNYVSSNMNGEDHEMVRIEAYCRAKGKWYEMVAIGNSIREMARKNAGQMSSAPEPVVEDCDSGDVL